MAILLGIDLGTSSVKSILMDETGHLLAIGQEAYSFDIPREGWAEQDPDVWWSASARTIRQALDYARIKPDEIAGIAFSGQMHGLVPLDADGRPVRKAIIWCDQRSSDQVERIRSQIGMERLGEITGNPVATGFQLPSLLWMKEHEPDSMDAVRTVLLPKDYVRYRLTGMMSTDLTDAASTLVFDTRRGVWSDELIQALELPRSIFPDVHLPEDPSGGVSGEAGRETGLAVGTPVFHGGADQVMQAVGNGILEAGQISVTIGTGGQVFAPLSGFSYDPQLRSHTFNHVVRDRWYFLGAALSAGLSLRWLRDQILSGMSYAEMDRVAGQRKPGSDGLVFLPYLSGERTPHMDAEARGLFFGLTLRHGQGHLARAVMEGVVFALRDCLEVYRGLGQRADRVIASGGGAQSPFWLQLQSDILNVEVRTSRMVEQAGVGAAITASVGAGLYAGYREACSQVIRWSDTVYSPDQAAVQVYDAYFKLYQELYVANRTLMHRCTSLSRS